MDAVPAPMIGEKVSHYRILQELGSGGMGVVYRAQDERLGREVALKFLPARLAEDPRALARFDREARLASSLNHPNICTVHDVDRHEGRPFIVMELCPGSTVKRLLAEGPLPLARALEVALQAAEALDAAHRRGVIHRDVKPANLFVSGDDKVKVLDFGLAKLAEGPAPVPLEELTRPGVALGTVAYMSPEQALGRPLDATSDLFSLGAVLYEMTTGERAFQGPTPGVVFDRILNREPPRPRKLAPSLPVALQAILDRLLAKSPEDRYPSAAALVEDLRSLKRDLAAGRSGTTAVGGGTRGAVRRSWPRWVAGAGALAVSGALVAAALLARGWRPPPPLGERDPILLAGIRNQTGEAVFDETLSQALAVQLGQSPFLNIVADDPVRETLRLMGRPPEEPPAGEVAREVCQRLNLRAMVEGSIRRLGSLYVVLVEATECSSGESLAREQGQAARREQVLEAVGGVAAALRSRLGESLRSVERFDAPIARATTPSLEALRAYTLGLAERRRGAEVESIPFFERALELDPQFAAAAATLSTVYGNLGEGSKSVDYARRAYASRDRVSERERLLIVYQYHDRVTGDHRAAADTLEVWEETYRSDFRPANALALLHNRLGDYPRGVAEAEEALRRTPGHPFALSNLAHAFRALGRDADARRVAEEAVTRGVATVPTRRLLYQLAVSEGRAAEAAQQLQWAKGRPREFDLVAAQAQVAAYEGRLRDAAELYRATVLLAEQRGLREAGVAYVAHEALAHAVYGSRPRAPRPRPAGPRAVEGRRLDGHLAATVQGHGGPRPDRGPRSGPDRRRGGRAVPPLDCRERSAAADDTGGDRARPGAPGGGPRGAAPRRALRGGDVGGPGPRLPPRRGTPSRGGRPARARGVRRSPRASRRGPFLPRVRCRAPGGGAGPPPVRRPRPQRRGLSGVPRLLGARGSRRADPPGGPRRARPAGHRHDSSLTGAGPPLIVGAPFKRRAVLLE
jgi:tetratricopeptide (TPR) repeat protein